jgi:hypothetical protein
MPLTQEDHDLAVELAGLKPWEGRAEQGPDGSVQVFRTDTSPSSTLGVFGRHALAGLPGSLGAAAGMSLAGPLSAAAATGASALAGGPETPLGIAAGIAGGAAVAVPAGMAGASTAEAIDAGTLGIRRRAEISPEQLARDVDEHPWASRLGRFAGQLGVFGAPGKQLATGLGKFTTAESIKGLTAAERTALTAHTANAGIGAGLDTVNQLQGDKPFDAEQLAEAAVTGGLLGAPGSGVKQVRGLFGRSTAGDAPRPTGIGEPAPKPANVTKVETVAEDVAPGTQADVAEVVSAPGSKFPVDAPTPEPAGPLTEALRLTADPASTKRAAFIPAGSAEVAVPEGMAEVAHAKGRVIYNPAKVSPEEAAAIVANDQIQGTALGLSQDVKPATGDTVVTTDSNGQRGVLTEVVDGSPESVALAKQAQAQAAPGGVQRVVGADAHVAERAVALSAEERAAAQAELAALQPDDDGPASPAPVAPASSPHAAAGLPAALALPAAPPASSSPPPPPPNYGGNQTSGAVPPTGAPRELIVSETQTVPNSVARQADNAYKGLGEALVAFRGTADREYGLFNTAIDNLSGRTAIGLKAKYPVPVIQATTLKMQEAHATGVPPVFTPEEQVIADQLGALMRTSAARATAAGFPIKPKDNYFPHIIAPDVARAYERDRPGFRARHRQEFIDWNLANYGPAKGATPDEAGKVFDDYFDGLAKAPSSHLGADFGALTKNARQFGLPPGWRDPNPLNALKSYGQRYAREIAKALEITSRPDIANALGLGDTLNRDVDITAQENAARFVEGTEGTRPEGGSKTMSKVANMADATQQFAHAMAMQTFTAVRNLFDLAPHMVHMRNPKDVAAFITGSARSVIDYKAQYAKALAMSVIKPNTDPSVPTQGSELEDIYSRNVRKAAMAVRTSTGAGFFEVVGRLKDYSIGEARARVDIPLALAGDLDAAKFLSAFGQGVVKGQPFEEQVARVARNYAVSTQGTYSGEGLPPIMVDGNLAGKYARLSRYSVEQMNRMYQNALVPAANGDFLPLIMALFGYALSGTAILKLNELVLGRPSGFVTEKEAKEAGADPNAQMALNLMEAAQMAGFFGWAGNAMGAAAGNIRGKEQPLFGNAGVNYVASAYKNLAAGVEALREGEPVVPVVLEVLRRVTLDQMQLTRGLRLDKDETLGFGRDEGLATDLRNKAVFRNLTGRNKASVPEIMGGLLTGNTFNYGVKKISPTQDKARAGDIKATMELTGAERRRLANYTGGFEDAQDDGQYRMFLRESQGQLALDQYMLRKLAFKRKAHGLQPQQSVDGPIEVGQ